MHDIKYLETLSKSPELQQLEWLMCKNDPYYWLTHWARTIDNHYKEGEDPMKTFPEKDYIKIFVKTWLKDKILFVPKSRQMMVSWLCVALYLWDTQFHKARLTAIQSKAADDADELIQRLKQIWDNEPKFLKRYYDKDKIIELKVNPNNRGQHTYCKFEIPAIKSKIIGVPQGGDKVRMLTLSGMLCDEAAFQPEMEDAYTALKPTLSSGGRVTIVSTPETNTWFEESVFDQLIME